MATTGKLLVHNCICSNANQISNNATINNTIYIICVLSNNLYYVSVVYLSAVETYLVCDGELRGVVEDVCDGLFLKMSVKEVWRSELAPVCSAL